MINYVYSDTGEYAGMEADGVVIPSATNSGVQLQGWMGGCPGMMSMIDGDVIYDIPTTIHPADPLFGLALLECIEAHDWVVTEVKPVDDFVSPTANALAKSTGGNCGIGKGGFQHGNTCARGGSGIHIQGLGEFKKIKDLPGSTGPILVEGPDGKKYVMKSGKGKELQIKNEVDADHAYTALGVPTPHSWLSKTANGETVKMSEYIEGGETFGKWKEGKTQHQIDAMKKEIGKHLAADAVLANWDVAGQSQDNILVKGGVPYRIDNGGALAYRAQGQAKGSAFGTDVTEHDTLRNPSKNPQTADIFKHVTNNDLLNQANELYVKKHDVLQAISDPKVKAIVNERINNFATKMSSDPEALFGTPKTAADLLSPPTPKPTPVPTPKPTPTLTPTAAPQSPGGNPLHSADGVTKFIHANKGHVPFSDLYTEKLQVMNPDGVKHGVFFIPSFPTGEKSSLEKVDQLTKILPPGTVIKKKSITAKQVEEWKVNQKGMTPDEAKATTKSITPGKSKAAPAHSPHASLPMHNAKEIAEKGGSTKDIQSYLKTLPLTDYHIIASEHGLVGYNYQEVAQKIKDTYGKSTPDFLTKQTTPGTGEHILQQIAKSIPAGLDGDQQQAHIQTKVLTLSPEDKGKLKAHLGIEKGGSGTTVKAHQTILAHGVVPKAAVHPPNPLTPAKGKKAGKTKKAYTSGSSGSTTQPSWAPPKPPAGEPLNLHQYVPPAADNSHVVLQHSPIFNIAENQKWADSLTPSQNSAVSTWKGSATAIRAAVENGTATPGTTAGHFIDAITKSAPHEGVIYRGIHDKSGTHTYATDTAKHIMALGVGGVWSDPSPHCCSVNPYTGNDFSKGKVMMRIVSKTGRPIQKAGFSFTSTGPSAEMEVVGMPGVKYKIKAIAQNVSTSDAHSSHYYKKVEYLIDLEEI